MNGTVRERYWVIKGHATARKVIGRCPGCRIRDAARGNQVIAPLPAVRVYPGRPSFASYGVDYAGPFVTKLGRRCAKRYVCLFTCLATRAIHLVLECAYAWDVDSFMLALSRLINRRGTPEEIVSDNCSNFVGAEPVLKDLIRGWDQNGVQSRLAQRGIRWRFNPPESTHQGGVWERLVRSIKRVMKVVAGNRTLADEAFSTYLVEIERIINGRPIASVSSDSRDLNALTPNALLTGSIDPFFPLGTLLKADGYRRS